MRASSTLDARKQSERKKCAGTVVTGRAAHRQSGDQLAIVPASDTRTQRRSGKSMSRRSGQGGYIERSGNWYVVRFRIDVLGQEKRQNMREEICPISGPGALSASERTRKAKEIIAASGADSVEHFEKVVSSNHGVTFRQQATRWLHKARTRKREPVAPSTAETWECALKNWINPNIGDTPLDAINNSIMRDLVAKMDTGGLSPKSIGNYAQIVKMVVASAVDEQGEELYPRKWNHEFIDMPVVNKKKQKTPSFTSEVVAGIIRVSQGMHRVLFILCAAAGLRIGEALGIDIKDISSDCTVSIFGRRRGMGKSKTISRRLTETAR